MQIRGVLILCLSSFLDFDFCAKCFCDGVEGVDAQVVADGTVAVSEVTNMQQARAVLMAEPYNCQLAQLQNKSAIKAVAQEKGISFPNWL